MSTEKERWAKLAGLPESTDKQQLDENFVGMGMVGNIFDREKEKYEDAFEHFLSERYEEKVEENYTTEVRDAWPSLSIDDRVNLLLTVFDDPDMAEEMAEKDFDALPDAATSNMRMDMLKKGELNEGELDFYLKDNTNPEYTPAQLAQIFLHGFEMGKMNPSMDPNIAFKAWFND